MVINFRVNSFEDECFTFQSMCRRRRRATPKGREGDDGEPSAKKPKVAAKAALKRQQQTVWTLPMVALLRMLLWHRN